MLLQPVGRAEETFRRMPDKKIKEHILQSRYSHRGYIPSLDHPDRPETVLVYNREVKFSWHTLPSQMQVCHCLLNECIA